MSVDFEAIAQRGHCDVSNLRLALPLLEQGYSPPFLARYRRDELGGLDESSLWALSSAMQTEQHVARRREELHKAWEQTSLRDPAIGHAISKSNSLRMLSRLGRRLKSESSAEHTTDAARLAVRVLNPRKGDGSDFAAIAAKVEDIGDADAAVAGLDAALAKRLAGDPRIIAAAVRWLAKNARIHIASISDPHVAGGEPEAGEAAKKSAKGGKKPQHTDKQTKSQTESALQPNPSDASTRGNASKAEPGPKASDAAAPAAEPAVAAAESTATEPPTASETAAPVETQPSAPAAEPPAATEDGSASADTQPESAAPSPPDAAQPPASETPLAAPPAEATPAASTPETETSAAPAADASLPGTGSDSSSTETTAGAKQPEGKSPSQPSSKSKTQPKAAKKQKKVSPRQRRRRWLVGVLKPLAGKRFNSDKLSSFQIVMLGRALRSQVAQCSFEYDATKLVGELQRVAAGVNRHIDAQLRQIVLDHEASIREAAEAAWWDDLHERASARLVTITADHLRQHVNRGAVEAKVVMAIDAIGPRTAATSIVSSDGQLLHNEDLPCQLSAALRSQAVARMGELIHHYHVDLLIISNGPARRASMIALSDLISQSPEKSVRWTVADRSGADAYASSAVANEEMRSTPRRFRAAAWLAFSVLQPAQALAKVDPLKLRLSSFQRELSDDAMRNSLEDVMISGASRAVST